MSNSREVDARKYLVENVIFSLDPLASSIIHDLSLKDIRVLRKYVEDIEIGIIELKIRDYLLDKFCISVEEFERERVHEDYELYLISRGGLAFSEFIKEEFGIDTCYFKYRTGNVTLREMAINIVNQDTQ